MKTISMDKAKQKVATMNLEQLREAMRDPDPMIRAAASWKYYSQFQRKE